METYVVSALRYRPQNFEEVLGQQHITQTLENAIEKNQLAQALLFCGPRGVGKHHVREYLPKKLTVRGRETRKKILHLISLSWMLHQTTQ